jgi:hypothetical protein
MLGLVPLGPRAARLLEAPPPPTPPGPAHSRPGSQGRLSFLLLVATGTPCSVARIDVCPVPSRPGGPLPGIASAQHRHSAA